VTTLPNRPDLDQVDGKFRHPGKLEALKAMRAGSTNDRKDVAEAPNGN
jgi:hypothetical protein